MQDYPETQDKSSLFILQKSIDDAHFFSARREKRL